jgi:hypothetical protein
MATNEKQSTKDDEFDRVEDVYAEPWKDPKIGDHIGGIYLGHRIIKGERDGTFNAHVLQRIDGKLVSVAGSGLDARMFRVPQGTKVRVTFKGFEKVRGGNMKSFELETAKGTKLLPISFTPMGKTQVNDEGDQIPF